jgi:hypothetical protein
LRPVSFTASRNARSSNAFIDERSITGTPGNSARIDASVGRLKPAWTPTVDSTTGTLNALAVLASRRA